MIEVHDALVSALTGRYEIERVLGSGGMAVVYLAHDLKNHRQIALKVLRPELTNSLGAERFLQEIAIVAPQVHPNIVPLLDSDEVAGFLYYTMPYVQGESLRQRLEREAQLPIEDALSIARQVAAALDYSHSRDTIHRDIKPDNILLLGSPSHVLVADFGLARAITRAASRPLTTQGIVVGTPMYMSPEQCSPEGKLNRPSDIYSLGCVVFEMIAGVPPFRGATVEVIMYHHQVTPPPSLCSERRSCPPALDEVVRRALAKSPGDRYQTAGAFSAALDRAASIGGGAGVPLEPRPPGRRRWWPAAKGPRIALGAVAVAVVVGAGLAARRLFPTAMEKNDWVLVADFDGPAEDPHLADAFRDLATTALGQSRFVRILDRRQLNDIMHNAGIPETTHVDVSLGRQLAVRSSVRAVLLGSIRPLGADYSIALHVVDADDGAAIASATGIAQGPEWQRTLVPAVDGRVQELRRRLGERRRAIEANRPLREVATPSFDAFRKYSAALDRVVTKGDFAGSSALAKEAIALDSGFASAWALLASNYQSTRQLDSARIAYDRAVSLPGRLSQAELYRVKGDMAYTLDHDLPAAVRWYDLFLAEQPLSRSGRSNRAVYRSALGEYEQSVADLREAVALNPFGPRLIQPTLLNLAAMLVVVGRPDEAAEIQKSLTGPIGDYLRIMRASAAGRWKEADSISLRVARDPSVQGAFRINALTSLASARAAEGSIRAADSVLRMAAAASRGSTARWYERQRLLLLIASGTTPTARRDLVPTDTTPAATILRGLWGAAASDSASTEAALARARTLSRRDLSIVGAGPLLLRGEIAARKGRWDEVVSLLGPLALAGEHDPTILDRPDSYLPRWLVANAYERLGRPDSAMVYLALILRPTRIPPAHLALRGLSHGFASRRLAVLELTRSSGGAVSGARR